MSVGTGRKPTARAHPFVPDSDAPKTCARCHLIKPNAAHDPAAVAEVQDSATAAQAEERRRLGERED